EVPRRADARDPRDDEPLGRAEEPVCAGVDRDGPRAVARNDGLELGSNLVYGGFASDRYEAVFAPPEGAAETFRVAVLLEQLAPLHAEIALRDGMVLV